MWRRGAQAALLLTAARPQLLQLVPLVPGLELLRHQLPRHQPDGVVGVLLQRGRAHQPGVRWRRLQVPPGGGGHPFLPLPLLGAAHRGGGGWEAPPFVWILRREEAIFSHRPDVAQAGLGLGLAAVLVWAARRLLLRSEVEAVGRRAELGDLGGSVAAWRADAGGGGVLRAAVLRARLVRPQRGELWGAQQEVGCTAALRQPRSPPAVLRAEALPLSSRFTFGESEETRHVELKHSFCQDCVNQCVSGLVRSVPEGLGVLAAHVQLRGGGGAGGVAVTQSRVLDKLRERNPAALCRHLGPCWTTANTQAHKVEVRYAKYPVGGAIVKVNLTLLQLPLTHNCCQYNI